MKELSNYLETSTIFTGIVAMITTDKVIGILTIVSICIAIIGKLFNFVKHLIPKLKKMLEDKKLDKDERKELANDVVNFIKDTTNEIKNSKEDK